MNQNFTIVNFTNDYIEEAVELALEEYKKEQQNCPELYKAFPICDENGDCDGTGEVTQTKESNTGKDEGYSDIRGRIKQLLQWLSTQTYGKSAIYEGHLVGYLLFAGPWDGFHGNGKGVFSPLGGSAFGRKERSGMSRNKLATLLFSSVADDLVKNGIFSCALSRYAHDTEVGEAFIFNGFGIRCSDAILTLPRKTLKRDMFRKTSKKEQGESTKVDISKIEYAEIPSERMEEIHELMNGLVRHLCRAPILFPTDLSHIREWFGKGMRVFVAKREGDAIGYISVQTDGENFITDADTMMNICGAFFREEDRGSGLAEGLLRYLCETLQGEGVQVLGVDYETMNPTALHFWTKYFMPYTYSYARRFDERIEGYEAYLERFLNKDSR